MRSSRRPGQATRISTPSRRACDLGAGADAAVDGGAAQPGAGAQVPDGFVDLFGQFAGGGDDQGARALARARSAVCCRMGRTKAAVLPVPVWAVPIRSSPASAAGMAASWMGVGLGIAETVDPRHQARIQIELVEVHKISFSSEVRRSVGESSGAQTYNSSDC